MNDDDKVKPFNKNRSEAKASSWRDRFTLTKLADIVPDDEPLWLIDSLIPAGPSLGVIFGKPKTGKTFLTADMFLHVAMGRDYCGCAVQQGAVIYITKEGVRGFKRRMMAMRQHHNAGPQVPFYVAHEMPNFGTNSGDADALVALIRKLVPPGVHIAAIIIDTLARTMPGQSDSDPAVMSLFVENCDTVAKAFDCFVGAVHHSPRSDDTRSRGSNVLDAAADVIISVMKERDRISHRQDRGHEGRRGRAVVAVSGYRKAKPKCRFHPRLRNHLQPGAGERHRNQGETKVHRGATAVLRHPPRSHS